MNILIFGGSGKIGTAVAWDLWSMINYYLWEEADTKNEISAMARVTGFSAAIGALFIGGKMITSKGIIPPEDGIKGELYETFIDELRKRKIEIIEQTEVIN
jgi:lysine 6-dehydrogenase